MQDNSQLGISGHHQYPASDVSGSGADHLQQQSAGLEHHVHGDDRDHESKSEQYGVYKASLIFDCTHASCLFE